MKRNLLVILLVFTVGIAYGQTYYWVGNSKANPNSFTNNSNWNTQLDGTGASRSAASTSDILIIDGSNVGGTTPQTGVVTFDLSSAGIGQLILQNNARVVMKRSASGTATITINGNAGDDLVVDNTSRLDINVEPYAVVISMTAAATGRISGTLEIANGPHRLVAQAPGALVFENGASAYVNITASTYPFGGPQTNPIAARNGVVFEAGSHLYFEGGRSPFANWRDYQILDLKPGSNFHFRASNSDVGVYLATRSFSNVFVENSANVVADGPVNNIDNLTIEPGSSFTIHARGSTAISGDLVVNGTLKSADNGIGGLVFSGETLQTVSGTGTITVATVNIADGASVKLAKDIEVTKDATVYGAIDFGVYSFSGTGSFHAKVNANVNSTGDVIKDSTRIANLSSTANLAGLRVSGDGIPENTFVVTHIQDSSWLVLSHPVTATGNSVAFIFSSDTATLATSAIAGFDIAAGSLPLTGDRVFEPGLNYVISAPTNHPFGISTDDPGDLVLGAVKLNADATAERSIEIAKGLTLNGKLTVRPGNVLRIREDAVLDGVFGIDNYIATSFDASSGLQGFLRYDAVSSSTFVPIGTSDHYLPVSVSPAAKGRFDISVAEGITSNGLVNGTQLSETEKQSKLNVTWFINTVDGVAADIQLQWNAAVEGSTFATLPGSDIGVITNDGSGWGAPMNIADNTANTASAGITASGIFSVGAQPQVEPFIFNEIPVKTYGDPDFNGGASSLNTSKPIVYTSSDPAVATANGTSIHIVGAGTAIITASQESDGSYPAVSIDQELTVNKAELVIKADDKSNPEAEPLPELTATYTGFVNNETPAVLLSPAVISTTATIASPPGTYPITVSGASAANYAISFEPGVMTILPKQQQVISFAALPAKRYGNADFAISATSTNSSIPVTLSSSNTNVATIAGNIVHIVGAGTTEIKASQAGNAAYFPAEDVVQTLTVDKAPLTIAVRDTTKVEGEPNPPFTVVYTGFVLSEDASNLTTPVTVNTLATTSTSAGYYTLTPENATSNNYAITFTPGRLTILPAGGTERPVLNAYMSNPTTLTTRIYSNAPALSDVVLWDLNGKPLIKRNTFLPKGFISVNLMVGGVPSGVYIVTVRGSGVDLKQMIRIVR